MKVYDSRPERLELRGIPHAGFALLGGAVVCPILMATITFFLYLELKQHRGSWLHWDVGMLCFAALFVAFLWAAALIHFFRRERLVLDRRENSGFHAVRWVFGGKGKTTEFTLDRIHAVSLEAYMSSSGPRSFPKQQLRARLLLTKPRRAILLESTESGLDSRVEPIAQAVAEWLGTQVLRQGKHDD